MIATSNENKTQAETLIQQGHEELQKKNLLQAIEHYSAAIDLDPSEASYFTHRAVCYQLMRK